MWELVDEFKSEWSMLVKAFQWISLSTIFSVTYWECAYIDVTCEVWNDKTHDETPTGE